MTLAARAPGKVNLCLFLGGTRDDGLHALVSLVQPVSLADELWLEPDPGAEADAVECPGVEGPNLAAAALAAYREATGWAAGPHRLRIAKHVPVAAGMGGGSGDAAATLRLADHAAGGPARGELGRIGAGLGADVPVQLHPGLALMTGAGETVEPMPDRTPPFGVLVIASPHALRTPDVYAEADRLGLSRDPADLQDREHALRDSLRADDDLPPADLLVNDLEPAARSLAPGVDAALADVRAAGAAVAMVSGSGPTVFGLFSGIEGPALAAAAAAELAGRHPGAAAAMPVDAAFAAVREEEGVVPA
jgi:4-diphosphocytidyl-2-C-methyl-D-erythritol kinase